MTEVFGPENFLSVFQKQGGNFNFEKNVEFLEFFGFTLRFRTFQEKKIKKFSHQTDRKISASIYLIFWRILKLFTTYRTDRKIACTSVRLGSKPWALFAKSRLGACKAVYHPY